jgi:hypothetical protein
MKRSTGVDSLNPVFSKPSKAEQKIDATTRLVRSIIDGDAAIGSRGTRSARTRAQEGAARAAKDQRTQVSLVTRTESAHVTQA